MSNYREIVTKAVIGKGKKTFTNQNEIEIERTPSTILGCWVINHNFIGFLIQLKLMVVMMLIFGILMIMILKLMLLGRQRTIRN